MVITSVQLDEDAGVPLAGLLTDAFRIRFARGFGADCVATILADAPVGATTAGASTVTQTDLLALVDSVDAEYAASDSAGWAMSWDTLLNIFTRVVTTASGGDALYRARRDAKGHYLLLGLPVFISNSLADIGAGNKSILFGDWSRFLIRNVPTMAIVWRFDELFMKNYQLGWEMTIRADSKIVHAGGSEDDPIKVLQCHT
jgi:HK97 family phage major capsid protein